MAGLEMFPRLQKRGPIEADNAAMSSRSAIRFHAYKSVAPLKLMKFLRQMLTPASFHAYKSVAPLKPHLRRLLGCSSVVFPRLQKRGPIEAGSSLLFLLDLIVSTLTKAWPH